MEPNKNPLLALLVGLLRFLWPFCTSSTREIVGTIVVVCAAVVTILWPVVLPDAPLPPVPATPDVVEPAPAPVDVLSVPQEAPDAAVAPDTPADPDVPADVPLAGFVPMLGLVGRCKGKKGGKGKRWLLPILACLVALPLVGCPSRFAKTDHALVDLGACAVACQVQAAHGAIDGYDVRQSDLDCMSECAEEHGAVVVIDFFHELLDATGALKGTQPDRLVRVHFATANN